MNNYNYKCVDCGNSFTDFNAILEQKKGNDVVCPKCKSKNVSPEGCCADKNSCDINCRPDGNKKDDCGVSGSESCCG